MRTDGTSHLYRLDGQALREMSRAVLPPTRLPALAGASQVDAWERKVLGDFLDGPRLKEIPASRKRRHVILAWLAGQFEIDRYYPEAEVNEVIRRHHDDTATPRREMIGAGLMRREQGVYWRVPDAGNQTNAARLE